MNIKIPIVFSSASGSIILLLVISMIVNVLAAWGCMLWSPYTEPEEDPDLGESIGPNGIKAWWYTKWGVGVWETESFGGSKLAFYRSGFPMLSMQAAVDETPDKMGNKSPSEGNLHVFEIARRGFLTNSFPIWMNVESFRRIPFLPIWLGFAVNTMFYFGVGLGFMFLWKKFRKGFQGMKLKSVLWILVPSSLLFAGGIYAVSSWFQERTLDKKEFYTKQEIVSNIPPPFLGAGKMELKWGITETTWNTHQIFVAVHAGRRPFAPPYDAAIYLKVGHDYKMLRGFYCELGCFEKPVFSGWFRKVRKIKNISSICQRVTMGLVTSMSSMFSVSFQQGNCRMWNSLMRRMVMLPN